MKLLESICKTIELIKSKHTTFKIKVASICLNKIEDDSEHGKIVKLLSIYKVREFHIGVINDSMKGILEYI